MSKLLIYPLSEDDKKEMNECSERIIKILKTTNLRHFHVTDNYGDGWAFEVTHFKLPITPVKEV